VVHRPGERELGGALGVGEVFLETPPRITETFLREHREILDQTPVEVVQRLTGALGGTLLLVDGEVAMLVLAAASAMTRVVAAGPARS